MHWRRNIYCRRRFICFYGHFNTFPIVRNENAAPQGVMGVSPPPVHSWFPSPGLTLDNWFPGVALTNKTRPGYDRKLSAELHAQYLCVSLSGQLQLLRCMQISVPLPPRHCMHVKKLHPRSQRANTEYGNVYCK